MTTKTKGGRYTLLVTHVQDAVKTRNQKFIHLITFQEADGSVYKAEEYEAGAKSNFIAGKLNTFDVTTPGINGNPDWIRHTTTQTTTETAAGVSTVIPREDLIIAQTALKCAVDYGIKYKMKQEEIIDLAYTFAGNVKIIARQISEEII